MEKINSEGKFKGLIRYNESMSEHTTFKTGGKADLWIQPDKEIFLDFVPRLLEGVKKEGIPVFVLGGGANILVSDRGIRGIVLDTGCWKGIENNVSVLSGTPVDYLVDSLAAQGLSGLEFLAGMPGSAGGAVWMNARCYGRSISDVLTETEILDENYERKIVPFRPEDFSYKKSPFQDRDVLILRARFAVQRGDQKDIDREIASNRRDRGGKGHFRFPSAGSAFKNNPAFGDPSGKIIDQAGLRGLCMGGAQVAPWHGNIIINTGGAAAGDIKALIDEVKRRIKDERGFDLEPEILFVGEW